MDKVNKIKSERLNDQYEIKKQREEVEAIKGEKEELQGHLQNSFRVSRSTCGGAGGGSGRAAPIRPTAKL